MAECICIHKADEYTCTMSCMQALGTDEVGGADSMTSLLALDVT